MYDTPTPPLAVIFEVGVEAIQKGNMHTRRDYVLITLNVVTRGDIPVDDLHNDFKDRLSNHRLTRLPNYKHQKAALIPNIRQVMTVALLAKL